MNNSWTYRPGEITEKDQTTIRLIAKADPALARIFLAGAVQSQLVGELTTHHLLMANDLVDQPLFVLNDRQQVVMTRFDAGIVWPLLGKELLLRLIAEEADRFGFAAFEPSVFDFFESLFVHEELFDSYLISTDVDSIYIDALTLFRKPFYQDIHPSSFFASYPEIRKGRLPAPDRMLEARDAVWDKTATRLTNAELDFLAKINKGVDKW